MHQQGHKVLLEIHIFAVGFSTWMYFDKQNAVFFTYLSFSFEFLENVILQDESTLRS